MRYIPLTKNDQETMLKTIGVQTINDLFASIPQNIRKKGITHVPKGMSESELLRFFKTLSQKNGTPLRSSWSSYLGCGANEHFIPSVVDAISMRGEYATAYTPYQPEVSQGTLQAIFEFQSMVANLFGMEVANASMYDGASAAAEAVLMALRVKDSERIYLSAGLHPEYKKVILSYISDISAEVIELPLDEQTGQTNYSGIKDSAAAVVVAQPNFYGVLEDVRRASAAAKSTQAMLVAVNTEPVAYGMTQPPGFHGADIVVGEGQSFGSYVSFGGPYVGLFATKKEFIRQMPGRLVGETIDQAGKKGYVLTLSTREQHIRRDKATSNICTNHSLCALRAAIHMALLGESGVRELAKVNYNHAHYLKTQLAGIAGLEFKYSGAFFNEFAIKLPITSEAYLSKMEEEGILGGVPLSLWNEDQSREVLISVTETKTLEDLDKYVSCAKRILR